MEPARLTHSRSDEDKEWHTEDAEDKEGKKGAAFVDAASPLLSCELPPIQVPPAPVASASGVSFTSPEAASTASSIASGTGSGGLTSVGSSDGGLSSLSSATTTVSPEALLSGMAHPPPLQLPLAGLRPPTDSPVYEPLQATSASPTEEVATNVSVTPPDGTTVSPAEGAQLHPAGLHELPALSIPSVFSLGSTVTPTGVTQSSSARGDTTLVALSRALGNDGPATFPHAAQKQQPLPSYLAAPPPSSMRTSRSTRSTESTVGRFTVVDQMSPASGTPGSAGYLSSPAASASPMSPLPLGASATTPPPAAYGVRLVAPPSLPMHPGHFPSSAPFLSPAAAAAAAEPLSLAAINSAAAESLLLSSIKEERTPSQFSDASLSPPSTAEKIADTNMLRQLHLRQQDALGTQQQPQDAHPHSSYNGAAASCVAPCSRSASECSSCCDLSNDECCSDDDVALSGSQDSADAQHDPRRPSLSMPLSPPVVPGSSPAVAASSSALSGRFSVVDIGDSFSPTTPATTFPAVHVDVSSTRAVRRPHQHVMDSLMQLHTDLGNLLTENDQLRAEGLLLVRHVTLLRQRLEAALQGQLEVDVAQETLRHTDISGLHLVQQQLQEPQSMKAHGHYASHHLSLVLSPTTPQQNPLASQPRSVAAPLHHPASGYCNTPAANGSSALVHSLQSAQSCVPTSARALHPSQQQQAQSSDMPVPGHGRTNSHPSNITPSPALVTQFFAQQEAAAQQAAAGTAAAQHATALLAQQAAPITHTRHPPQALPSSAWHSQNAARSYQHTSSQGGGNVFLSPAAGTPSAAAMGSPPAQPKRRNPPRAAHAPLPQPQLQP